MKIGEKSLFMIEPEYGHLPLLNFIENKSDKKYMDTCLETIGLELEKLDVNEAKKYQRIIYEVELLLIDKPRKQKSQIESTEEKIEIANDLKSSGIIRFKESYFKEAEDYFTQALEYLTKIPSVELKQVEDLKLSLILNIVNCLISQNKYSYALEKLKIAFSIKIVQKCYYYRAIARMHNAEFELSLKDINKLEEWLPGDSIIKDLKSKLANLEIDYNKNTKKLVSCGGLYNDKKEYVSEFPIYNKKNRTLFLDLIKNKDKKNPVKLKFEIYKEIFSEEIVGSLSSEIDISVKLNEEKKICFGIYEINSYKLTNEYFLSKFMNSIESSVIAAHKNNYNNFIFPVSEKGLLVLKRVSKEDNIENENNCFELFISLDTINHDYNSDYLVLGKCFYNIEFLDQLNSDDKIELISKGLSLNLI